MKFKKQLYWIGIGAVLAVVLALFFIYILPDWLTTIPDQKTKLAEARETLDKYAARDFETNDMLKAHRQILADIKKTRDGIYENLLNKNKGLYMSLADSKPRAETPRNDADFRKTYGGKDTEFKQNYGTTYGNLLDALKGPKGTLKLKIEKGSDGSEVLRNYKNETPENIIKKFNIQRAIVNACNESGASAIEFVRINEPDSWAGLIGSEKGEGARAIGEIPSKQADDEEGKPGAKVLDAYYRTIKVAFAVEIRFGRISAILESMSKSPILFRFYGMEAVKYDLKQKPNISAISLSAGKTWKVVRDGEEVETAALSAKFSEIWNEADVASVFAKSAGFGEHPETKKVVIPYSAEMIEEPPVRVVFLYEALEFAPPMERSGN